MSFQHNLNPSDVLTNQGLMDVFKCSNSGGMRRSHHANTLLIISDHTKSTYDDRWIGDVFHYTAWD
jgi:5-methylcytosine-specific restriction enzyme A